MSIADPIAPLAERCIEEAYRLLPRPQPTQKALQNCKLIAHRGVHHQQTENTMPAFQAALDLSLYGIEFDIRWTKDLIPVVSHDLHCNRLFNKNITIADIDFITFRKNIPEIPTLEEVIAQFGKKIHLMIELKEERLTNPKQQGAILTSHLKSLNPAVDYHLLSLTPSLFDAMSLNPVNCLLPVAQWRVRHMSQLTKKKSYAGLAGHFLLLNDRIAHTHQTINQSIGTGMVNSKYCFFRELNRGVDWVFSDCAENLEQIRRALIS